MNRALQSHAEESQQLQQEDRRLRDREQYRYKAAWTIAILALLGLAAVLLWYVGHVLLLLFGALLVGNVLHGLSRWVHTFSRLSYRWSLLVVLVGLAALIVLGVWFMGPPLLAQMDELAQQIPRSLAQLRQEVSHYGWGRELLDRLADSNEQMSKNPSQIFFTASGVVLGSVLTLAAVIAVVVMGIFLAFDPALYVEGFLLLIPPAQRDRSRCIVHCLSETMWSWMIGKALTMLIVAAALAAGLWLMGMPLWLTLGILAGLLSFVPNFGPIAGAVPAVLVALPLGWPMVLGVIALNTIVQVLETNLITPQIQHHMVLLPPALIIFAQILLGVLFGLLGVMLATPLAAMILVLVKMVYVRDILGDARGVADLPPECQ